MPVVQCADCERHFEVSSLEAPVPGEPNHENCPGAGKRGTPRQDIEFELDETALVIKNNGG